MRNEYRLSPVAGWLLGIAVFVVGLLNIILVHPVPGVGYLLLSVVFLPPANDLLKKKFGFSIPAIVKIILGIIMFLFTFGVSDFGDMID